AELRLAPAEVGEAFFFSSRRRHTRLVSDWSSDVCSSDLRRRAGSLQIWIASFLLVVCLLALLAFLLTNASAKPTAMRVAVGSGRSEERRVGKEWRFRWSAVHLIKDQGRTTRVDAERADMA